MVHGSFAPPNAAADVMRVVRCWPLKSYCRKWSATAASRFFRLPNAFVSR